MDLVFRAARLSDLPGCVSLLEGHAAYGRELLTRLPVLWRRLLSEELLAFTVVEEGRQPGAARILAFGASVFVGDEFMREARAGAEPHLTARALRAELQGVSPILRPAAIQHANAGDGLNVVILHYGEDAGVLDEEGLRHVRYTMLAAFLWMHRGYRVKEVLQEFWDEIDPAYVSHGWGRVRTDYADFYARQGLPRPGQGPCLIGLARDEVAADPGITVMAPLFVYTPPQLGFRRGEQQLLEHARLGRTDAELARALRIALPTVKSRWRAIYERVRASDPELLPDEGDPGERRGKEKRRRVLEYVQRHPEELRPFASPCPSFRKATRRRRLPTRSLTPAHVDRFRPLS